MDAIESVADSNAGVVDCFWQSALVDHLRPVSILQIQNRWAGFGSQSVHSILRHTLAQTGGDVVLLQDLRQSHQTVSNAVSRPKCENYQIRSDLAQQALQNRDGLLATVSAHHRRDSVICAPIDRQGKLKSVLHLYRLGSSRPFSSEMLLHANAASDRIRAVLNRSSHDSDSDRLSLLAPQGHGPYLRDCIRDAVRKAQHARSILVLGGPGTGKRLFAKAMAYQFNQDQLSVINCEEGPDLINELRSVLTSRVSGFDRRMVICLDEVLALDEKQLRRLVSDYEHRRWLREQVTLVVTSSASFDDEASCRKLNLIRQHLEYAVQLRSIKEDSNEIVALALAIAESEAPRLGYNFEGISESAQDILTSLSLPKNWLSLKQRVLRALVRADGGRIEPEHFLL